MALDNRPCGLLVSSIPCAPGEGPPVSTTKVQDFNLCVLVCYSRSIADNDDHGSLTIGFGSRVSASFSGGQSTGAFNVSDTYLTGSCAVGIGRWGVYGEVAAGTVGGGYNEGGFLAGGFDLGCSAGLTFTW